jgi:excisionase family DNA binding protein
MTVKHAAQELGISLSLVYALLAAGRIRHERHGLGRGTIRIPREALDEYRKSVETTPKTASVPVLKHLKV